MQKLILTLVFLLLMVKSAFAESVSVSYQILPEILLPGDYADVIITLHNPTTKDVRVNSIVVSGARVEPTSIFSVGTIPPGGSYSVTFSVKGEEVGRKNVRVSISTENETIIQNILLVVDDSFPSLTIASPIYRGAVNEVAFYLSSPIELKDVRVETLFDAIPKTLYLGDVVGSKAGSFKFKPESEKLRFKISFYNGRNFHEMEKEVKVELLTPKDVVLNVSIPYKTLFIGDVITIPVEVTNLRIDSIYAVTISASSALGTLSDSAVVAKLEKGESKTLNFKFSPSAPGEGDVVFKVEYEDELGNSNSIEKSFSIKVLDSYAVQLSNLEVRREGLKVSVSGDISNNGRSEVYNAYAFAVCGDYMADYFIGNVDPSDFQSFELPLECNNSAKVTVKWSNEIGETFEMSKEVELKEKSIGEVKESPTITYISIAVALVVLAIIVFVIYRQIRK